jgi:hypothetical protein
MNAEELARVLDEMIEGQRRRLLMLARRIAPEVAPDDLLQPHDHPRLSTHPEFQYEDGVLAGYLAIRAALRAQR